MPSPESDEDHPEPPVTTTTGDEGFTGLLGPERVTKYALRPTAFGTLDEASSALGLARAFSPDPDLTADILALQKGLYQVMAELATSPGAYHKVPFKTGSKDVADLELIAARLRNHVTIGKDFIIPGDSPCGAALDLARTVVRRGERIVARLYHEGDVTNPNVLKWLNRLSDTIFIMARFVERPQPQSQD